ncbi:hypothetical protein [Bradyrhizobium tunisiense]|uniref:hypothetical protein n=1 Tax=Bradyrhizobium tunisiense TaxID=3278709 RepID=UPI0035DA3157
MEPEELIANVEKALRAEFAGSRLYKLLRSTPGRSTTFGAATIAIKSFYKALGERFGFTVACGKLPGHAEGERLYDVVWYSPGPNSTFARQALVLETEMKAGTPKTIGSLVDRDFSKLVQARADIRVWMAPVHNTELLKGHIASCKRHISEFSHSLRGDCYIFIAYNWTSSETFFELYRHGKVDENAPNVEQPQVDVATSY